MNFKIDNLQYCKWDRSVFEINREAGLDAVHVTIVYHEDFDELQQRILEWKTHFKNNGDLIFLGKDFRDIEKAKKTYNNQSLLASGCYEKVDSGVTNFGKEAIKEMNRVGVVVDMSHSGEKSTFDAIELSQKPIAITHSNPNFWHKAKRNKSNDLLKTLSQSGGMLGFSLYPHHLNNNSICKLDNFCEMVARTAEIMDVKNLGMGSDLCLNQPDAIVEWMRNGTWTKKKVYGEGTKNNVGFPDQPSWFKDARGFKNIESGLKKIGFNLNEINGILGNKWYNFYKGIN